MVYFARIDVAQFTVFRRDGPSHIVWFVKIGKSVDPTVRIKYLQSTQYGLPVTLLAAMPGDLAEEKAMHARFAHLRLPRLPGATPPEWFYPATELLDFVKNLSLPS